MDLMGMFFHCLIYESLSDARFRNSILRKKH